MKRWRGLIILFATPSKRTRIAPFCICYAMPGAGFDIVSGGELFRAQKAGANPAKCTFRRGWENRTRKSRMRSTKAFIPSTSRAKPSLITSTRSHRPKTQQAPIALRVNPDVEAQTHQYISTGKEREQVRHRARTGRNVTSGRANCRPSLFVACKCTIGSQITEAGPFMAAIGKTAPLVSELKSKYAIEFFSIGGGLGIAYESSIASWQRRLVDIAAVASADHSRLRRCHSAAANENWATDFAEPGRLLVGNAEFCWTRVRYIKKRRRKNSPSSTQA